jgi:hypothetical protein
MRLPRGRFTVRRVMVAIAICGVALAVVRQAPVVLILIGPLIGSLWDMSRGGKGLTGGLIGGAMTWGCLGLASLAALALQDSASINPPSDLAFLTLSLFLQTAGGAVVGLMLGVAAWFLRYLATLPRVLRQRAERSARANSYRPPSNKLIAGTEAPAMRFPRVRLTVRRVMIGVALCGLGFLLSSRPATVAGMTPNLIDPPGGGAVEVIARMFAFGLGPLIGVAWHRLLGGRGVLGGLLAGAILYGGYSLYLNSRERRDPFSLGPVGDLIIFSLAGAWNGLILGVVAWGLFGVSGWVVSRRGTSGL